MAFERVSHRLIEGHGVSVCPHALGGRCPECAPSGPDPGFKSGCFSWVQARLTFFPQAHGRSGETQRPGRLGVRHRKVRQMRQHRRHAPARLAPFTRRDKALGEEIVGLVQVALIQG